MEPKFPTQYISNSPQPPTFSSISPKSSLYTYNSQPTINITPAPLSTQLNPNQNTNPNNTQNFQKTNNNYSYLDTILNKLKETDEILIKEYQLFLTGKNYFINEKSKLIMTIDKYFSNLIESFQNEHKNKIYFIEKYYKQKNLEFNEIDELLQKNKRIINKAIRNINTLKTQKFLEVKLSDQLTLIEELELNTLLDDNINNKIKYFLYQIKKNIITPKIIINENVYKLVQNVHGSIVIEVKTPNASFSSINSLNLDNIIDMSNNSSDNNNSNKKDKNKNSIGNNNPLISNFINNNDIYLEEESNEIKNLIDDVCQYINKLELTPNFFFIQPNSNNIFECQLKNSSTNLLRVGLSDTYNNSIIFGEDFRYIQLGSKFLYITGGQKHSKIKNDVYEYNILTKEIEQRTPMIEGRKNHGILSSDKKVFVCGGEGENGFVLDNFEMFDCNLNRWENLPKMKLKLQKINLVWINEYTIACFGGINEEGGYNNVISYFRTDINTWFLIDNVFMPYGGVAYPGLCKISEDWLLVMGGSNQNNQEVTDVYKMDINTGTFAKLNQQLNYGGYFLCSPCLTSKNEINIFLNQKNLEWPIRYIFNINDNNDVIIG